MFRARSLIAEGWDWLRIRFVEATVWAGHTGRSITTVIDILPSTPLAVRVSHRTGLHDSKPPDFAQDHLYVRR